MGAHVSPHPESPTLLPPHLIPLGCPRAPDLSVLLDALNLHWSSILHMVIYMFLCYSLKSSHPRLLPQSTNHVSHRACGCHIPLVYFLCEFKFNVLARLSRAGPDIYVDSSWKPGHVDDLQ